MASGDNNRKISEADRDEIVRLYTERQSDGTWFGATSIARRLGVSHPTIYRILKLRGVARRSCAESHAHGKRCKPITNFPVGDAPACKCGCGQPTPWNQRKNRWQVYASGHYTRSREQSPSWKGGVYLAPYTFDWPVIADRVRWRDDYTCRDCGGKYEPTDRRGLHVHHIDEDPTNNADENLVSLCRGCHSRRHPIAERIAQGRSATPTRE